MLSLTLLLACQSILHPHDSDGDTDIDSDTEADGSPAAKPDFEVCGGGADIQSAIDASSPGDWIRVCPGTYGPIAVDWSQDVTISSSDGPDATTIDGGGKPAVIVKDGTLVLDGFHVTGTALEDPYYPEGAAFSVHEGDLTVANSRVTGTTGSFTVLFDENFLAMDTVTWEDNNTDFLWYLSEGDNVDVLNNTVIGGKHQSIATTPDLDNLLLANNVFAGTRIATAFSAFDLKSNGVGRYRVLNNVFWDIDDADPYGGRLVSLDGDFRDNIVGACNTQGLYPFSGSYSIFWDDDGDYASAVSGTGNQFVDPKLVDYAPSPGSPAIDAGDPALKDGDGSRNDIGATGGPYHDRPHGAVDPEPTETITGSVPHTLTVDGGYGGGSYLAGQIVHVWADVDPQSEVAIGWTGTVASPGDWNTTFVMPDADATVSVSTTPVALPLVESTYHLGGVDRSVLQAIPASPKGLVLFFHSADGNNTEIRGNAASSIARLLYAHGYGIVAMNSDIATIAGHGGWGDGHDDETLDLAGTRELLNDLALWDVPVIAWGVGEGAGFAHTVGYKVPADAVISFGSPGRRFTVESTSAATAWFLPDRDSTWRDAEPKAVTWAAAMNARGVAADVYVHRATPLYDARFTRIAGIDAAKSKEIADEIRAKGYVDEDGNWLVRGEEAGSDQFPEVAAEIRAMAADDALYDDQAAELASFLDRRF